jgi:hypothetical protein
MVFVMIQRNDRLVTALCQQGKGISEFYGQKLNIRFVHLILILCYQIII